MQSKEWVILPSDKAAERRRRTFFNKTRETVWLGEHFFSLHQFLKNLVSPAKPLISRQAQKHLIHACLKKHPLRFFDKLRHRPALTGPFQQAIRELKRFHLLPEDLRERLKATGTLKENDLLTTYERYEALKDKLGVLDDEDLYTEAVRNLHAPDHPLSTLVSLRFENFSEKIPALHLLPAAIAKTFPKLKIVFEPIAPVDPSALKNIRLLFFASPHNESRWFVQQTFHPSTTGILTGQNSRYNESIWQKLKNAGHVEGISPFLNWNERPEGRRLLAAAAQIDAPPKPLAGWLELLQKKKIAQDSLGEWVGTLLFADCLRPLGPLAKDEWMDWLEEALQEKPAPRLPETLSGLQWFKTSEGDFASLETLWVPGLVEGAFPALSPPSFFPDAKDRSTPEWQPIVEAFPDPQRQFEKQRREFLFQLSQIRKECFLTYPRQDSLGKDLFASPLTWDFGRARAVKVLPSLGIPPQALEQKLKIEEERWSNRLQTASFHADFRGAETSLPLAVQQPGHLFSPSRLEAYAECPFKYFANRVLNIPEVREYSPEVDPQDRGDLFHQCLEILLTRHGKLFAEAKNDPAREKLFFEKLAGVVEEVFGKMAEKIAYANSELYKHLREKTGAQAAAVLKNEIDEARELESPLVPGHFEWAFGEKGEPPLNLAGEKEAPILVRGRIDRIDTASDPKRFLVLDYKTGDTDEFKKKLLEGLSLQLPIYILAVKKLLLKDYRPAGGMLISVKKIKKLHGMVDAAFNKVHFKLRKDSPSLMESGVFEAALAQTVDRVREYAASIRQGYFSAQPKDCKVWCDYKEICRYAHKPI